MSRKIGVGVIGASGWSGRAHIPAIKSVPTLELRAVATGSLASAQSAAHEFDVPLAFGDPLELIRHPDIDLVSVVVKAPEHGKLVRAAIEANKAILCEWPLGKSFAETEELASTARRAGVRTAIGLQGRASPWINHVRNLVRDGYVGRVLSTTLLAADELSMGTLPQSLAFMLDDTQGANPLTIHTAHFIDTLSYALGEPIDIAARVATSLPEVVILETGERVRSTAPDQTVVAATLEGGALASVHVRAGRSPGDNVHWEIQGTDGYLKVTLPSGYMHWGALDTRGAKTGADRWEELPPPKMLFDASLSVDLGAAHNVAYLYAAFARDLLYSTSHVAGFDHALARHRTIKAIADASRCRAGKTE
jgi:predicted dehydrogenase